MIDNATGGVTLLESGDREAYYQTVATLMTSEYPDGSYTILVEAVDKGGNRSEKSATFTIDTVLPDVSVIADKSDVGGGSSVIFTVSASDDVLLDYARLRIEGRWVKPNANGQASYTFTKVGEYDVVAYAYDKAGNVSTHTIQISVTEESAVDTEEPAVSIAHNASSTILPGQSVTFTVNATDNVGVTSRTLTVNGQAVTLNANGVGSYTFNAVGTYEIIATATDAASNVGTSMLTLQVVAAPDIQAPVVNISHDGQSSVTMGQIVDFSVTATDDVGVVSRTLTVGGTAVTLDSNGKGVFAFTTAGTYEIIATATDAAGNVGMKTISIVVIDAEIVDENAPIVTINYTGNTTINLGQSVNLGVSATDDIGVASLTLYVNGAPVELDGTGAATLQFPQAGVFIVRAVAVDAAGNEGSRILVISVVDPAEKDTQRPTVSITHDAVGGIYTGKIINFQITAADNVGVASVKLFIDDVEVALDADGRASHIFAQAGSFWVDVIVTDTSGNTATDWIQVVVTRATYTAPTVRFEGDLAEENKSLEERQGVVVKTATEVRVSVGGAGETIDSWEIKLRNTTTGEVTVLATGSGAVDNDVAGMIDAQNLKNGSYILTVTATNADGYSAIDESRVVVAGESKLGNFTATFPDLQLQVGGIPVTISRNYDTLNAGVPGDFGYGWSLGTIPLSVTTDCPVNLSSVSNPYLMSWDPISGWYVNTNITINLPDGQVASIRVYGEFYRYDAEGPLFFMRFEQLSGPKVDFEISGYFDSSRWFVIDEYSRFKLPGQLLYYNPTHPTYAGTYNITMEDGTTYYVSATTGQCTGMKTVDGKTLTITSDGVVAKDAGGNVIEEVKFVRNAGGIITHVVDPQGNAIEYRYDGNGDLVEVVNREGETNTYSYVERNGASSHYLQTITDNSGTVIMDVDYDMATGRIRGITDANGNRSSVQYTLQASTGASIERVENASGLVSEIVRNSNGDTIRVIQHIPDANNPDDPSLMSYLVQFAEYDAKGNCLGVARAFTVTAAELEAAGTDVYSYEPADLFWEQRAEYDADGRQTGSTDAYGKTTYYEYDSRGNLTKTTDPFGNEMVNEYDEYTGKLLRSVDASGIVTRYEYEELFGNIYRIIQELPSGTELVLTTMFYDLKGRVVRTIDSTGRVTNYGYDAGGRQTLVLQIWTDPETGVERRTGTRNQYDAEGRVSYSETVTNGVVTSSTRNEYDASGNVVATIDQYGLRTEYAYDSAGRVLQTRRQSAGSDGVAVWLVSRTVYDALGRVVWQSDETVGGGSGMATYTEYDLLGRVVRSERRDNVRIVLDADGTRTANEGTLVSYSAQGYDAHGRTEWTENSRGVRTYTVYTREGQVAYTITDLDGDLATTNDQTVSPIAVYDEYGRQVENVLDRDDDIATDDDRSATRYEYDGFGRVVKTVYADETFVTTAYDALGRKSSETDQLGNVTRYEYDDMGRLTAVVLPASDHPVTGERVHVRYEYGYDSRGNQTSLRDNIYMTDPEDAATIDRSGERETVFAFDSAGRQISRTLPNGLTEYFYYDSLGRTERHVSFEGRVTSYEYDAYDRLSRKLYFASVVVWNNGSGTPSQTVLYEYDYLGRVVTETDSSRGETSTTYNAQGQVSRISSPEGVISYEYDPVTGQVTRTWTGTDSSSPDTDVRNAYDVLGRLETVRTYAREGVLLGNPEIARYVYDAIGNLDRIVHSNGVVSDYVYNAMNRLIMLTHYAPDGTPETLDDNPVLQRYEYSYYDNGHKSGETFTDANGNVHTWEWLYDELGRLTRETHDNADDLLDYATEYVYDLVGNRLEKRTDTDGDNVFDEVVKSNYDRNDRLLNELKIVNNVSSQQTTYSYAGTDQTGKTVRDLLNSRIESTTSMEYNAQGRMSKITIVSYVDGVLSKTVVQEYAYDSSGIKVTQSETVYDASNQVESSKETTYLNDKRNHTGYSQVLEERTTENGQTKTTTYTIGHDVLSQHDAVNGLLALLADGHGSTRAVADMLGRILQQYSYNAYGNAVGFNASEALTNLLYSGEQFNPVSGLQYLRARWYNPQTGTFNRLDPFSGNRESPLSFHKYAYAHMNPVMYNDPTGRSIIATILLTAVVGLITMPYVVSFINPVAGVLTLEDALLTAKINVAMNLVSIFSPRYSFSSSKFTAGVMTSNTDFITGKQKAWASTLEYHIAFNPGYKDMSDIWFASLLLHEVQHLGLINTRLTNEAEAYTVQTNFIIDLINVGIENPIANAKRMAPGRTTPDMYLHSELVQNYEKYTLKVSPLSSKYMGDPAFIERRNSLGWSL